MNKQAIVLILAVVAGATAAVILMPALSKQPPAPSSRMAPVRKRPAPASPLAPQQPPSPPTRAPASPPPAVRAEPAAPQAMPPAVAAPRPPRSDQMQLIVGEGAAKGYGPRIAAVHQLSHRLARHEVEALYAFMRRPLAEERDLDPLEYNAVKNDVLEALIAQEPLPPDLGRELVAMFRDGAMDEGWRDYCLQHFALYYERRWPADAAGVPEDPEWKEMMAAYREALEGAGELAGTALIGLEALSLSRPEVSRGEVADAAVAVATNPRASPGAVTTALQVCGMCGRKEALARARELARSAPSTSLRLSAIALLGQLGAPEDVSLLDGIARGPDARPAQAARAALERLARAVP